MLSLFLSRFTGKSLTDTKRAGYPYGGYTRYSRPACRLRKSGPAVYLCDRRSGLAVQHCVIPHRKRLCQQVFCMKNRRVTIDHCLWVQPPDARVLALSELAMPVWRTARCVTRHHASTFCLFICAGPAGPRTAMQEWAKSKVAPPVAVLPCTGA